MKKLYKSVLLLATLGISATSHAAVTFKGQDFGFDVVPAKSKLIIFDTKLPKGFALAGGSIRNIDDGSGAEPAIADATKEATYYLAVNAWDPATITSRVGYRDVSFYWGSMDAYNTVTLLGKNGTKTASYSGDQIWMPANGNQWFSSTNRRVSFSTTGRTSPIYGIEFTSTQPAFEIDNVVFSSAVPEPASWAMMIGGLGLVGCAMRRSYRRSEEMFTAKVRSIALQA